MITSVLTIAICTASVPIVAVNVASVRLVSVAVPDKSPPKVIVGAAVSAKSKVLSASSYVT